jgi:hypothetical protein
VVAALAVVAGALPGCGDGPTLTASEFVGRINHEGARIELGRKLPTQGDATELYAIKLPPLPGEPRPPPDSESGPGATGTLYLFGDTGGAEDQLKACRSSGLLCIRAANVVVVLEEGGLEAQRLAVAVRRLGD